MKKKIYAALAFALYAITFHAQQIYELSAPVKEKTIYTGHLKMGGSNPSGGNISVNSYYMSIDGKPVIPVPLLRKKTLWRDRSATARIVL